MKFQTFALFSAGLLTAAFLGACQRTGDKTTVADGRDPRGQSKPQSDLTKVGGFKCSGDVILNGEAYKVNKLVNWNGQTAGQENLLDKVDQKDNQALILLQVQPRTGVNAARMAISVRNLEKDKDFVASATVQNEVQLTLEHQGAAVTKVNVLCEPLNPQQPDAPFKLNNDKKVEVLCQGTIGKKGEAKELHDPKVASVLVGTSNNDAISFEKLNLGTALVNTKLISESSLLSEKSGKTTMSLNSEDGKLKVLAQAKTDMSLIVQVVQKSETEEQQLIYGCNRADLVSKSTETKPDATTVGDARDTGAVTTTTVPDSVETTTSTTVPEISPVQKEEIKID